MPVIIVMMTEACDDDVAVSVRRRVAAACRVPPHRVVLMYGDAVLSDDVAALGELQGTGRELSVILTAEDALRAVARHSPCTELLAGQDLFQRDRATPDVGDVLESSQSRGRVPTSGFYVFSRLATPGVPIRLGAACR